MRTIRRFFITLILIGTLTGCSAAARDSQPSSLQGRILVVGNEPLVQVILRTEDMKDRDARDRDVVIEGPLTAELRRDFKGKAVTLEGVACTSTNPQYSRCMKAKRITVE